MCSMTHSLSVVINEGEEWDVLRRCTVIEGEGPAPEIPWMFLSSASVPVLPARFCGPPAPGSFQPRGGGGIPRQQRLEAWKPARAAPGGPSRCLWPSQHLLLQVSPLPPAGHPAAAALRERKRGAAGAPGLEAEAVRGAGRLAAPPAAPGAQGASPSSLQEAHAGEEARGRVLRPAALRAVGQRAVSGRALKGPPRPGRGPWRASTRSGRDSGRRPRDLARVRVPVRVRVCACARVRVPSRPCGARAPLLGPQPPGWSRRWTSAGQRQRDRAGPSRVALRLWGRGRRCSRLLSRSPPAYPPRRTPGVFVGCVVWPLRT